MTAKTPPPSLQDATAPDPRQAPRAFLEHLYRVAVDRALPLSTLGAHLPKPPKGRTLVLGAGMLWQPWDRTCSPTGGFGAARSWTTSS